jgi:hypothetical protein
LFHAPVEEGTIADQNRTNALMELCGRLGDEVDQAAW